MLAPVARAQYAAVSCANGGRMDLWRNEPLGFVLVDEPEMGSLAVHHLSVSRTAGVEVSGAWLLRTPDPAVVRDLLTQRIVVGTASGVTLTNKLVGEPIRSADLALLVTTAQQVANELEATWRAYRDQSPKKRSKLKPVNTPTWPTIIPTDDAATILIRAGKVPFQPQTPLEMRGIIALATLVRLVMVAWYGLETERLSRSYLRGGDGTRRLFPSDWLTDNGPYRPTEVFRGA